MSHPAVESDIFSCDQLLGALSMTRGLYGFSVHNCNSHLLVDS
jgi:hypothetical protein